MLGMVELERAALEMTYDGRMTVVGASEQDIDGETTVVQNAVLFENQPCALSLSGTPDAEEDEDSGIIRYQATIFCAPELSIPSGCCIAVTQYGKATAFRYSGEGAMYPTHQQISVEREERSNAKLG